MKQILFACCLLTATFACVVPQSYAQSSSTSVDVTLFRTKVNLMDSLIGAGSMTAANTTWNEIHTMLTTELAATKANIAGATTTTDRTTYTTLMTSQWAMYQEIWALKSDLATNRATIKTKLLTFASSM
ncbi:MAG: hypothetical protein EBZ77_01325 [Chitinophagia bacterium]|nr:hypothetical protein [Chitinophagia bacterium]